MTQVVHVYKKYQQYNHATFVFKIDWNVHEIQLGCFNKQRHQRTGAVDFFNMCVNAFWSDCIE